MKRIVLLMLTLGFGFNLFAQNEHYPVVKSKMSDIDGVPVISTYEFNNENDFNSFEESSSYINYDDYQDFKSTVDTLDPFVELQGKYIDTFIQELGGKEKVFKLLEKVAVVKAKEDAKEFQKLLNALSKKELKTKKDLEEFKTMYKLTLDTYFTFLTTEFFNTYNLKKEEN